MQVLEDAIQKINNHNTTQAQSVSTLSFEELYRRVASWPADRRRGRDGEIRREEGVRPVPAPRAR